MFFDLQCDNCTYYHAWHWILSTEYILFLVAHAPTTGQLTELVWFNHDVKLLGPYFKLWLHIYRQEIANIKQHLVVSLTLKLMLAFISVWVKVSFCDCCWMMTSLTSQVIQCYRAREKEEGGGRTAGETEGGSHSRSRNGKWETGKWNCNAGIKTQGMSCKTSLYMLCKVAQVFGHRGVGL